MNKHIEVLEKYRQSHIGVIQERPDLVDALSYAIEKIKENEGLQETARGAESYGRKWRNKCFGIIEELQALKEVNKNITAQRIRFINRYDALKDRISDKEKLTKITFDTIGEWGVKSDRIVQAIVAHLRGEK